MNTQDEIAALKAEVQRLSEQVEARKADGFRGSAAERMLAMEYELIPDYMKTPKAIRVQKQINTWGVPAFFVILAIGMLTTVIVLNRAPFAFPQTSSDVQQGPKALAFSTLRAFPTSWPVP